MQKAIGWAAALLVCAAAGCGPSLPPETDAAAAKAALTAALDAWKAGGKPDALKARTPQVVFNQPGWADGPPLEGYEIKGESRHGQGMKYSVALRLAGGGERVASYTVDAGPGVVVIAPEM